MPVLKYDIPSDTQSKYIALLRFLNKQCLEEDTEAVSRIQESAIEQGPAQAESVGLGVAPLLDHSDTDTKTPDEDLELPVIHSNEEILNWPRSKRYAYIKYVMPVMQYNIPFDTQSKYIALLRFLNKLCLEEDTERLRRMREELGYN
ncbi:hypothetical protein KIPB_003600 [Kipferlia bialata]|uniref:Uncharacterized protein n=1 Tax=Kipferlia bialata TaxID=797122 RepID=A0A9K3CSI9_9EUKA|nr:hypothetical protein KIPB_003600 [Kipferlia bialata]|eukprot:g3600.t1